MKEAGYYTTDGGSARCALCPHNCIIKPGGAGICGVRENTGGTLYTTIYGEVTAISMDPMEKKPLYHFYPGSSILSIGTKGCNLKCPYCQNWHISQDLTARTGVYTPEQIVEAAKKQGSVGIAYTYSEPVIWLEFVLDCAAAARKAGLKNVLVTNGFINPDPLDDLLGYADAMNIDLKSFRDETYRKVMKGTLPAVKNTIATARTRCHVELTTLIVTGINDTMEEMEDIIDWIGSVDKNIPWHVSRYFPNYRHDAPPTDVDFMYRVCEKAGGRLNYVYCGNVAGGRFNDTRCPSCGTLLISRSGYRTTVRGMTGGVCDACGFDLRIQR
ncbi:MAG TPA: AmmeMemoRadiSam system radical SAM enzyme [Spirochaetes bacterium]|nr:AmmeMemoRadiSam system radical SAM enzyme [Spirochaetota bacterium]